MLEQILLDLQARPAAIAEDIVRTSAIDLVCSQYVLYSMQTRKMFLKKTIPHDLPRNVVYVIALELLN